MVSPVGELVNGASEVRDVDSGRGAGRCRGPDSIQRVGDVAHTPRMRGSAGAPPLGEGARSLWAPRGASHRRLRARAKGI